MRAAPFAAPFAVPFHLAFLAGPKGRIGLLTLAVFAALC